MFQYKTSDDDLQLTVEFEEDIRKHERLWTAKKIRQFFILGLIAIFCLMMMGNIFFTPVDKSSGVSVEYKHFIQQNSEMAISFEPVGSGSVDLIAIPYQYLKSFKLEKIVPQPTESYLYRGLMLYKFKQKIQQAVVIYMTPTSTGSVEGSWRLNNGMIQFSHFVYP